MADITHGTWIKDGKAVDAVYQSGVKVYGRNLYLNSKEIKDNMWHIVAEQGNSTNVGIYLYGYANEKLPDNSYWSYSADVKGTGNVLEFGIETGNKNPVMGAAGSEWSRMSQTGHFDTTGYKTIVMYFDTTNSPLDVYIKLPKLETGKMPTSWSPAPEDL